jgi:hypothetical protein
VSLREGKSIEEVTVGTWIWIVIVVVVVLVIAAMVMRANSRRRASLRQHFGPEYERTVERAEDRRAAEGDLRQRERSRAELEIRPLPEAARVRSLDEWTAIQERFVDQPSGAVTSANDLLKRVMSERGYPVDDFESRAQLISVDHPAVVENYRAAHRVYESNLVERASTEDLREALLRYRSLFDELLHGDGADHPAQHQAEPGQTRHDTADGGGWR